MSRSGRLFDLVHLLAGRRGRSMQEMVEHLEVSERTIYRDFNELERQRIPIYRDEGRYRLVEGATLRPLNLTTAERALLRLALANPSLRRQAVLRRRLELLEAKLDAVTARVEETPQALTLTGRERGGVTPRQVIETLERAIADRRAAEIHYDSLSGGDRRWRGVDPYRLFHRDGAWYLAGRCHHHDEPRIFRLDRIGEARPQDRPAAPRDGFDLESFLTGAWSIYRGEREHRVVLHAEASLRPLLENATQHPSETLRVLDDGAIEYTVTLTHLDEIARWVLGFGGRVRVVAPAGLRARVVELAEGVRRNHLGE